ncbi:hypothetical protein KFE25_011996 [Diacronema lutheri]|uniref:Uncharacterized protein n=1 Tax=Diacronema lutheri TaxID=2081491 RepID=A0A8J5XC19_DIALT|nr:hypothetical protein KFE25_011996 [Diacronema lutheri]
MGPDEARMCADGACPPIGGFDACEDPDGAGGACMCPPDTAYNAFALNKEGACSCSQICMPRALVKVASTNGVWYGGPSAGLCTAQPTMRNCTSVSKGRTFGVTFFIYRCDGTSPTGSHAPLTNGSADPLLGSCEAPHGGVGASRAHGAHLRARASSAAPDGSRTHSPHNRSRWAGAADAGLVLECDRTPVPADDGAGAGAGAGGNASGTRGAPGSRGARRLPSCDELRTKGIDVGPVDGKQRLLGASRSGAESARSASGGGGAHERASRHARARARARARRGLCRAAEAERL